MDHSDTVVVGAGAIGCATAFWLARAGLSVTVLERDRVAQHASSAGANLLAPLAGSDPSGPAARAGWASLELLREIESELEDTSELEPRVAESGLLRLAGESEAPMLREQLPGFDCSWLDRRELEAFEPRLDPRWVGAIHSPRESHVDGARLSRAFARGAEHYGARFELQAPAVGLALSHGCVGGVLLEDGVLVPAGDVILCTGSWNSLAGAWLDWPVPVDATPGELLVLSAPAPNLPGVVCGGGIELVPGDGEVWVGARGAGVGERADYLRAGAEAILPELGAQQTRRTWVAACVATPDGLPLVGRVPGVEGAIVATGFGRDGVLLCALTAAGIVELLVEASLPPELEPFDPARFAGTG